MRVRYRSGHRVPQHKKHAATPRPGNGAPPLSLGRENLLIGYARTNDALTGMHDWKDVVDCPNNVQGNSLALLAEFIILNMMADLDTAPSYVDNWSTPGVLLPLGSHTWSFRGANVSVDYAFSFPVATMDVNGQKQYGRIYVGYEGGGAY